MEVNLTLYRRSADRSSCRPSPYRAVNTFHLGYKKQPVYAVSGTSRCLFSDKYKNISIQCGQNVQLLNVKLLVHHVTSRLYEANSLLIYVISTERISVIVHKEGQQQAIVGFTVTQEVT